jgi:cholesterol transport system auxiliary component
MKGGAYAVRASLLLAAAWALAGCASFFSSKLPAPSLYLLSAHPGTPGPAITAELGILKPQVRSGLDTDRIAVLYADRRLDYYAAARWSARLADVVQDLAVQSFRARANLRSVSSDASAFSAGYWLEIEVTDFQAEYAPGDSIPTIRAHFSAILGKSSDRRILNRFEASATQRASENRLSAIVSAYEQAANSVLSEIVADTTRALELKQ